MIKKTIFTLLFLSLLFSSCGPRTLNIKEMPKLEFEKTPPYSIDLSTIEKPAKPNPLFGVQRDDGTITIIDKSIEDPNVVVFNLAEYKKVAQVVSLAVTYKELIKQQEVLINEKIKIENSLKEFLELERLKSIEYQRMWVDTTNQYYLEQYNRSQDNFMSKVYQSIMMATIVGISFL